MEEEQEVEDKYWTEKEEEEEVQEEKVELE